MADPGFLPGFLGVGITIATNRIPHHIGIAVNCRKELEPLRDLVTSIEPMVMQIHQWCNGFVGKGASGKTLPLKRVFRCQKVGFFFNDCFLLWLAVSQSPSLRTLRNHLCRQITIQAKVNFPQNMREEDVKVWLNQRIQGKRFALFLDYVWGEVVKLLEELDVALFIHISHSKIVVSSSNCRAFLEMGVSED